MPTDPIGKIEPSIPLLQIPGVDTGTGELTGVVLLLNSILKIVFIAAGLWGFFNLVIAGFDFMNAAGDAKKVASAWEKIWKSFVGLLIIVSSFLVAAVIGFLLFKDPTAILQPKLQ